MTKTALRMQLGRCALRRGANSDERGMEALSVGGLGEKQKEAAAARLSSSTSHAGCPPKKPFSGGDGGPRSVRRLFR